MRIFVFIYGLLLITSCVLVKTIKPTRPVQFNIEELVNKYPDSIPRLAWINLQNVSTFNYRYQFKSDLPHNHFASYQGLITYPHQEERQGKYVILNKQKDIKIKARGNFQYKIDKKTDKWQVLPRDEDANLMVTIERVIANTRFYLINQDSNYLTYSFHPNLSFLDPTFTRRIKAEMTLNRKTVLPHRLFAYDTLGKISWQVDFIDYDKGQKIKFPFLPNTFIALTTSDKLSKQQADAVNAMLTKRLDLSGENFAIKTRYSRQKTVWELDMEIPNQHLDFKLLKPLLVAKGSFSIFPLGESIPLLTESNLVDVKIVGFEPYPQIEIILNNDGINKIMSFFSDTVIESGFRAVLDTQELSMFYIDKTDFSDRITFRVLFNRNEIMNMIAILKGGLLSFPLEISEIKSGR